MRQIIVSALGALAVLAASFSAKGNLTISVPSSVAAQEPAGSFGAWSGQAGQIGETIIVPASASTLDSFSFAVIGSSYPFNLQALVAKWDQGIARPTGSALFSSSAVPSPLGSLQTLTFDAGHVAVTPGENLILMLNAKLPGQPTDNGNDSDFLDARSDNPYSDGHAVYSYMNSSDVVAGNWQGFNSFDAPRDLVFSASFTSVPEPVTFAVLLPAMTALLTSRKRS